MLPLTNMFQIQCLNSKTESKTNILAKFCIEPLKKGQGITIGNTLRRVLLSDLPGIAIVGVRISGVSHEFSTIPGLKEDIVELLLNLKQIIFKGKIGRIRDIKIHKDTGEIYMLSDKGELWRMYK